MCEFCLFPTGGDRDKQHSDFAGFFSPDAIEAAVRQANANRQSTPEDDDDDEDEDGGDDDSDGT
jgi:uncharacterized protein with LGFP repeats